MCMVLPSVAQLQDAMGRCSQSRAVAGDHDRRTAEGEFAKETAEVSLGRAVEFASRFVGEQEVRCVGQRDGDRRSSPFAARERDRVMVPPVDKANPVKEINGRLVGSTSNRALNEGNVGLDRHHIEKIVPLRHHTDMVQPHPCPVPVRPMAHNLIADPDRSSARFVQTRKAGQQS